MKTRYLALFLIAGLRFAHATDVSGRFTLGGYVGTERFSSEQGGSMSNDNEVLSSRLFLKVDNVSDNPWNMTLDLRDKNDFFGKADTERLVLTNANAFQIQELDAKHSTANYSLTFGRFHYQEAGVAGVDGGLFQLKHSAEWNSGVFAGWNPKTEDQTYYQFNPNNYIYGISNTFQTKGGSWNRNLFLSNGFVTESYGSEVDRSYFFDNAIYQWGKQNRLISMMYLDFVPRTYIQNGNLTWQEGYDDHYSSQLSVMGVDVITYTRQAGVLDRLAPSPYKEGSAKLDYNVNQFKRFELGTSDGVRDADGLSKKEYYLGFEQNRFFSSHGDFLIKGGYRNNFESNDAFTHFYLGYYTDAWEYGLAGDYASQRYTDGSGTVLHPLTLELDVSYFMSRDFYGMISFERAADEIVSIYTAYFKFGYRFGDRNVQPLRDGSPPKGQL